MQVVSQGSKDNQVPRPRNTVDIPMKILSSLSTLILVLSAANASAQGLECTAASQDIKSLTLNRDGGEETVTIRYLNQTSEKFLVLQNTADGKIVAIEDNAITGGSSNHGIALVYNTASGKGYVALNGEIIGVSCAAQ